MTQMNFTSDNGAGIAKSVTDGVVKYRPKGIFHQATPGRMVRLVNDGLVDDLPTTRIGVLNRLDLVSTMAHQQQFKISDGVTMLIYQKTTASGGGTFCRVITTTGDVVVSSVETLISTVNYLYGGSAYFGSGVIQLSSSVFCLNTSVSGLGFYSIIVSYNAGVVTIGTEVQPVNSGDVKYMQPVMLSSTSIVVSFIASGTTYNCAIVLNITGLVITYGSVKIIDSGGGTVNNNACTMIDATHVVFGYNYNVTTTYYHKLVVASISGITFTMGTPLVLYSGVNGGSGYGMYLHTLTSACVCLFSLTGVVTGGNVSKYSISGMTIALLKADGITFSPTAYNYSTMAVYPTAVADRYMIVCMNSSFNSFYNYIVVLTPDVNASVPYSSSTLIISATSANFGTCNVWQDPSDLNTFLLAVCYVGVSPKFTQFYGAPTALAIETNYQGIPPTYSQYNTCLNRLYPYVSPNRILQVTNMGIHLINTIILKANVEPAGLAMGVYQAEGTVLIKGITHLPTPVFTIPTNAYYDPDGYLTSVITAPNIALGTALSADDVLVKSALI